MRSGFECLSQRRIEFMNIAHDLIHVLRGVEACNGEVCHRSCTVHTGMLEYRVLLKFLWIATIVEADEVLDGDATIEDLSPDKQVERGAQLELSFAVQQLLDVSL